MTVMSSLQTRVYLKTSFSFPIILSRSKKTFVPKINFVCSNNNLISIATRRIRREPQFYKERLIFGHVNRGARETKKSPLRQKRRKLN